jgi:hypothetical protein
MMRGSLARTREDSVRPRLRLGDCARTLSFIVRSQGETVCHYPNAVPQWPLPS